jgi:hypothetical protein
MSEPAKDEADLVQCMAKAMHDSVYKGQTKWEDTRKFERYYREAEAEAALAAIRAAGWAVVPQTELDDLRAENARLREALEEIAENAAVPAIWRMARAALVPYGQKERRAKALSDLAEMDADLLDIDPEKKS